MIFVNSSSSMSLACCSERLGYGGDAAATIEAIMLNFDMAAFNEKRVADFNAGMGLCL